jgi:RsiW-degrading membrane proteinase PrsW (M82 family)
MTTVILLSFFLPFFWAYYFIKKDCHPEPWYSLLFAFLLGIFSALLSIFFEGILENLHIVDSLTLKFLLYSFIEEFFKFLVIFLLIFPLKVFDEPIDAIIYMSVSALGFAFIENVLYILKTEAEFSSYLVLFLRFLAPNFLHVLASSIIGFGFAYYMKKRIFLFIPLALFFATILHFIHNYFIIRLEAQGYLLIVPILWGVFAIFISELGLVSDKNELGISKLKPYEEL